MAFKCMTGQAPEYMYLTSQFITHEQVGKLTTRSSQKLNIALFTVQPPDRELFITGLLSFGTI